MGSTPIESTRISSEQAWLAGGIVRASKVFSGFSRGVVKPCGELKGDALKSCLLEDYVFFFVFVFLCFCLENGRNSVLASRGYAVRRTASRPKLSHARKHFRQLRRLLRGRLCD